MSGRVPQPVKEETSPSKDAAEQDLMHSGEEQNGDDAPATDSAPEIPAAVRENGGEYGGREKAEEQPVEPVEDEPAAAPADDGSIKIGGPQMTSFDSERSDYQTPTGEFSGGFSPEDALHEEPPTANGTADAARNSNGTTDLQSPGEANVHAQQPGAQSVPGLGRNNMAAVEQAMDELSVENTTARTSESAAEEAGGGMHAEASVPVPQQEAWQEEAPPAPPVTEQPSVSAAEAPSDASALFGGAPHADDPFAAVAPSSEDGAHVSDAAALFGVAPAYDPFTQMAPSEAPLAAAAETWGEPTDASSLFGGESPAHDPFAADAPPVQNTAFPNNGASPVDATALFGGAPPAEFAPPAEASDASALFGGALPSNDPFSAPPANHDAPPPDASGLFSGAPPGDDPVGSFGGPSQDAHPPTGDDPFAAAVPLVHSAPPPEDASSLFGGAPPADDPFGGAPPADDPFGGAPPADDPFATQRSGAASAGGPFFCFFIALEPRVLLYYSRA